MYVYIIFCKMAAKQDKRQQFYSTEVLAYLHIASTSDEGKLERIRGADIHIHVRTTRIFVSVLSYFGMVEAKLSV